MIRINLALKKQASYVGGKTSSGAGGALSSLASAGKSDILPILAKVLVPIAFCVAGNFGYDYYIQQKTEEMQLETTNATKERDRIQAELRRIKGFETVRAELEKNELILRTKIETIERLLRGRDSTLKSLVTLSQSLPKEVWLTEVLSTDTTITLRGGATDIGLISDVMARLGQSIYFKELSLRNSSTDPSGRIATFELSARRE